MDDNAPLIRLAGLSHSEWTALTQNTLKENADGFRAYLDFIDNPDLYEKTIEGLRQAYHNKNVAVIFAADRKTASEEAHPFLCIDPNGRLPSFRVYLKDLWLVENNVSIGNLLLEEIIDEQVTDGFLIITD